MVNKGELVSYLMERLGGEEEVLNQFYKDRVTTLIKQGATFHVLYEEAKKEKFMEEFMTMKVADYVGTHKASGKTFVSSSSIKPTTTRQRRMSPEEKQKMELDVHDFLKKNPKSGKADIQRVLGYDSARLASRLAIMKKEGKIVSAGSRATMVYSLPTKKGK